MPQIWIILFIILFELYELGKACFAHNAACSDNKDLAKRTISNKILKEINMMDIKED